MLRIIAIPVIAALASLPTTAFSQDARTIFETAQAKQLERWEGVDVYVVTQTIVGNSAQTYFQRAEFEDDNGNTQTAFLPASDAAVRSGQCLGAQTMTPEAMEAYAAGSEMAGAALGSEVENGLEEAGLPRNLFSGMGSDGTVSADPSAMMGNNAAFMRAMAQAQREEAARDPGAEAEQTANQMADFIEKAKLVGTESMDGRKSYHLRVTNIDQLQEANGNEYKMDTLNIWVDAEHYVPLRMKVDGTLTADGEAKPMTLETIQSDYRTVPDSKMYESYKQVMKISGMMDSEQEAQMAEAAEKMAELEAQMASMPASQRKMMESMIGPQLEMMKSMSSGGGFQTEVVTTSITINPEMVGADGQPCP